MTNVPLNNSDDPIIRILKSPEMLARIVALILALLMFVSPMVTISPERISASNLVDMTYIAAMEVGILGYFNNFMSLSGYYADGFRQSTIFIVISFTILLAIGLVLSLVPKLAQYARLSDLVAAIMGLFLCLLALGSSLAGGNGTIRQLLSRFSSSAVSVSPSFGMICLLISTCLIIWLLVSHYLGKRKAAA